MFGELPDVPCRRGVFFRLSSAAHVRNVPAPASAGPDPAPVQFIGDRAQGDGASRTNLAEDRRERLRELVACRRASVPFPARLSAAAPFGLPRLTPRDLATASASFVRRAIASRSCRATRAMMPTVRSFASGRSAVRKRTPLARRVSRKAALRERRSSLAIASVSPVTSRG